MCYDIVSAIYRQIDGLPMRGVRVESLNCVIFTEVVGEHPIKRVTMEQNATASSAEIVSFSYRINATICSVLLFGIIDKCLKTETITQLEFSFRDWQKKNLQISWIHSVAVSIMDIVG